MSRNGFKDSLLQGVPQVGLWLSLADGYSAELCASSGFDWLMIDGEHGPNHVRSVLRQLQAIAPYDVAAVVRPVNADPDVLKPLLDIGVTNLLIPMISTAAQARALVAAVRYPPLGKRGIGHVLGRASRWGRDTNYFSAWQADALIIVQIETLEALENLEEIIAVEGVDALFIGPADLAASMGYPGQMSHPAVVAAIEDAVARIVAAGKPAGTIAVGEEAASASFAKGCSFVAAGVDVLLLAAGADTLSSNLKSRLRR